MSHSYHIPTRPYSPIDALNRQAIATGSVSGAQKAEHADYNGHLVTISWNNYRQYYVCEYVWAGRQVLARGEFQVCLEAALKEYNRGARGASVQILLREGDIAAQGICDADARVRPGKDSRDWFTWRHVTAASCARDTARPTHPVLIFDWDLLQQANSNTEYQTLVQDKYGQAYT